MRMRVGRANGIEDIVSLVDGGDLLSTGEYVLIGLEDDPIPAKPEPEPEPEPEPPPEPPRKKGKK